MRRMKMRKARKLKQRRRNGDAALWSFKRFNQAADLSAVREGRTTQDSMSWFSGGRARGMKSLDPAY